MSDEDIRKYLSRQSSSGGSVQPMSGAVPRTRVVPRRAAKPQDSYKDFSATHLLCPRCKRAMPVRERLMLVLPDGDLYDYRCQACGSSCGTRKAGQ